MEFSNRLGTPCLEATYSVHQVLKGAGIRDEMKITASGQTATAFDTLEKIAVGANTVNAARSMMMALGCIQSLSCNTNHCPTGIATQDPARAIDVDEKAQRVQNFHRNTLNCFLELYSAMGHDDSDKLGPQDMFVRCEEYLKNFDEIFSPLD